MATANKNTAAKLGDEQRQRQYIEDNLPDLIRLTVLDAMTLAIFAQPQHKVLSSGDLSALDAIPNAYDKNRKFYELIQKRENFFEVLVMAMGKTTQTGVLALLNKFQPNGEIERGTGANADNGDIIVGSGKYTASKIVTVLKGTSFAVLFSKWTDIARELGTSSDRIDELQQDRIQDRKSRTDVIMKVVEEWATREGRNATLDSLITVLKNNELTTCAEALENM